MSWVYQNGKDLEFLIHWMESIHQVKRKLQRLKKSWAFVNRIFANELYKRLSDGKDYGLKIEHRDIGKDALRGK